MVTLEGSRSLRLVHTSDWHLGIELGTQSRRADHETAIDSLVERCREFQPDAIVHTGDLFDHARPGADDQALAVDALRRLSSIAPTVVVGGNHDNNVMLDRAWDPLAALAGAERLSFRGRPRRPEDGGVIPIASSDGGRRILVCAVPFLTPHSFARFDRPGETTGGFTAGIKRIHDAYNAWLEANIDPATDKVVWAAHLLVAGAQPAGSERRVDLGDDYATSVSHIPPVSYAAFGHIHRAQPLPGLTTGRYAGGMLPFRFDEARSDAPAKSAVLVEFPTSGTPKVDLFDLATGRPLVEITERLEDLPQHAQALAGAFVRVIVPIDAPTPGLMLRVAEALPDALVVDVRPEVATGSKLTSSPTGAAVTDLGEMLDRWLKDNEVAGAEPERTGKTVRTMVDAALAHRRSPLEEEGLLDADISSELARDIGETMDWADPEAEAVGADALTGSAPTGDGTAA